MLLGFMLVIVPPSLVHAQGFSETQRAEQIRRIKDGLNSPNSTTRIVTLEHAIAMKDATLRRVALSTAFASADSDLRSIALADAVASAPSFVVHVTGSDHVNDSEGILKLLGTRFEVQVDRFDRAAHTFQTVTNVSSAPGSYAGGGGMFTNHSGAVSGERLSFAFNINRIVFGSGCSGVAELQGGSTLLQGTMICNGNNRAANYTIQIDILR